MNGRIDFATDQLAPFDFRTVATYICSQGYELDGGDVVRTCEGDSSNPNGEWTGTARTCIGQL